MLGLKYRNIGRKISLLTLKEGHFRPGMSENMVLRKLIAPKRPDITEGRRILHRPAQEFIGCTLHRISIG